MENECIKKAAELKEPRLDVQGGAYKQRLWSTKKNGHIISYPDVVLLYYDSKAWDATVF